MDTNQILKENEISANRLMTLILNVTIVIVAITWALFSTGVFYSRVSIQGLMIFNIVMMAVAAAASRAVKYERRWVKYLLMASLTIVYAVTTSVLTYNVSLLMVIPIVMSVRYFSKRYTMYVAVLSVVVFFIAYLYGANHGMLDMNFVQYPVGTTIVTDDQMWLDNAVAGIPYDTDLMIVNTMLNNYLVKLMQMIIVAVLCVRLVAHGQDLVRKHKDLTENTARISAELDLATKIQSDMLPSYFPAFPERKEFDLYASMTPAKEVGGDFYDFFMIDDDHIALVIGDVSGKGVPASLFMAISKTIIRNIASLNKSPGEIFDITNNALSNGNDENMFVTAWLAIINLRTGDAVSVNAGHEHPVIRRVGGLYEKDIYSHDIVMGVMSDIDSYTERSFKLNPGDSLFVYTDGVPDATASNGDFFSEDGMMKALNEIPEASSEETVNHMRTTIETFVGDADRFDDVTMISFKYFGTKNS